MCLLQREGEYKTSLTENQIKLIGDLNVKNNNNKTNPGK